MKKDSFGSEIVEFRLPSYLYSRLKNISEMNCISESAVLCHFLSVGFVTLDYFKK